MIETKESSNSEIELVLLLSRHIDEPCRVEVDGRPYNIREFYLREAERILPTLGNTSAKYFLLDKINQYQTTALSQ